uniref:LRRCT domain-containing protein n=1 Tax=Globodera pallida TaxID=36090 RepID=A0A183BI15_GLOPA
MDVIKLNGNPFVRYFQRILKVSKMFKVCDCKLKWLLDMKNVMRTVYKTDEPTCKYPSDLEGLSLYDANKLNDLCDPTPSSTGKFVVFLVCMILSASLVAVGLVYARRRYEAKYGGDVHLPRFVGGSSAFPRAHQIGIFDDGEEEENEAEEQQPLEGGERPEFV